MAVPDSESPPSKELRTAQIRNPETQETATHNRLSYKIEYLLRSRPGWWCNSAEQAASERALDSAVVSERLAVVIANYR